MPGFTGQNLGLTWGYSEGEDGWGVGGYNPGFAILDSNVHLAVLDILSTPPSAPVGGDRHIVGASPTGSWASHEDHVAVWNTIGTVGWVYYVPKTGWRAYNQATGTTWVFDTDWIEEAGVTELEGDVVGGPGPGVITTTLSNTAVTPGSYTNADITVDAKGRLTAAANGTAGGGGITQLTGDVLAGPGSGSVAAVLANTTVAPGSYTNANITVDAKGRITTAANGTGGGASVTISDTPPGSPAVGDLWFDSDDTITLYVWMDDGSSVQWIPACNCSGGGTGGDFLALSGGTMEGPLILDDGSEAVSDGYCDEYLMHLTGSTMTGPLILSGDPTTGLGAATKQYVDNKPITLSGDISGSGTTAITTTLSTVNANVGTYQGISVNAKGQVVGATNQSYATQTYVNATFLPLAGGSLSGSLSVTGSIQSTGSDAAAKIDTQTSGMDAYLTYRAGTSPRQMKVGLQGTFNAGEFWIYDETAGAGRIAITPSGQLWGSSTWSVMSDARLKEPSSIQEYPRGLSEILALNPIYYKWNGKGGVPADGELHYGLSAQQVEEVMPELIREREYTPPDDEPMTVKTYSPTDLTYALVNAIKELNERISNLEAQLTAELKEKLT